MDRRDGGFSLIEALVVVLLVGIVSTVAIIQLKSTVKTLDADKAANLLYSEISYARQLAVDERRNVKVEFLGTNEIKVTRQDSGGGTTVMADVLLPTGYTFSQPGGGAGDTPDAFGNASAVYFNNGTSGTFLGDGTFVDNTNILLNGTVFTMGGGSGTARAVTLSGATGKIRLYWLKSNAWVIR